MTDHFARLGLPRRFALDATELEREYLSRSRAAHPDYHLAGRTADLGASLELSAALNEAYAALRDPFARAEHLLALHGGPSAAEHKQVPPAFLAEMLEAREEVEAARGNEARTRALESAFTARFDTLTGEVASHFVALDALRESDTGRANLLVKVRACLNAARYVRGLIWDLNAE
jgi:molecular chaperone HscB